MNFATKCTEHAVFKDWFPLERGKEHDLRATRKYAIPKFNCDRNDKSPLNFMRRLLNEEYSRNNQIETVNRYSR